MASELGTIQGSIVIDYDGKGVAKATDDVKGFTRKSAAEGGKAGKGFGSKFGGAVQAALGAAAIIGMLSKLSGAIKNFAKDSAEGARVDRLTAQVIESTGGVAKITAGQVDKLGKSISRKTGIDDDAIKSGSNLLLTFTKVRNEAGRGNDIFNQGTLAATNMSVALGTDMRGASILVGKALNDPIRGVAALTRSGVQFTVGQKAQIKAMIEAGDVMGAQKIILAELSTQFGGAAEAAATPWQKFTNSIHLALDPLEPLVLAVMNAVTNALQDKIIPAINNHVIPAFLRLSRWFKEDAQPVIKELAAVWLPRLDTAFRAIGNFIMGTVIPAVSSVVRFFREHEGIAKTLAFAIAGLVIVTKLHTAAMAVQAAGGMVAFLTNYLKGLALVRAATAAWTAVQWLLNISIWANPLTWIVIAIIAAVAAIILIATKTTWFQDIWHWVWNRIANTISVVWKFIKSIFKLGLDFIIGYWKFAWNLVRAVFTGIWNGLRTAITTYINFYKAIFVAGLNFIKNVWNTSWNAVKNAVVTYINTIKAVIQGGVDRVKSIIGGVSAIIGIVRNAFNNAKNAAADRLTALVDLVRGIPNRIKSALGNMASKFYSAGKGVILGLINGIKDMAGRAAQAAIDTVRGALDAAKSFLGIGSPSKVFEKEVGRPIPEGLARGVRVQRDLPRKEVEAMIVRLTAAPTSTSAVSAAGAATINNNAHYYTVRVSVDASKLRRFDDVVKLIDGIRPTARQFVRR
jgi:phage-related protein